MRRSVLEHLLSALEQGKADTSILQPEWATTVPAGGDRLYEWGLPLVLSAPCRRVVVLGLRLARRNVEHPAGAWPGSHRSSPGRRSRRGRPYPGLTPSGTVR